MPSFIPQEQQQKKKKQKKKKQHKQKQQQKRKHDDGWPPVGPGRVQGRREKRRLLVGCAGVPHVGVGWHIQHDDRIHREVPRSNKYKIASASHDPGTDTPSSSLLGSGPQLDYIDEGRHTTWRQSETKTCSCCTIVLLSSRRLCLPLPRPGRSKSTTQSPQASTTLGTNTLAQTPSLSVERKQTTQTITRASATAWFQANALLER